MQEQNQFITIKPIKLVYIHAKKTAGTSIREWLKKHTVTKPIDVGYNHFTLTEIKKNKLIDDSFYSFGVVRDPFTRMVSNYEYDLRINHFNRSFHSYVEEQAKKHRVDPSPQHAFYHGVNKILRFENLSHDFIEIQKLLDIWVPLEMTNSTTYLHSWTKYYKNKDILELVYRYCYADIKIYKYKKTYLYLNSI